MSQNLYRNFRGKRSRPKSSILYYDVKNENGMWISTHIPNLDRLPLFTNKPFCPNIDIPLLNSLKEKDPDGKLYVLITNQQFLQKKDSKPQEHSSIISETSWKGEEPSTTIRRCLKEEFGLNLKPGSTLTRLGQGKWALNSQKQITSFHLTLADIEPCAEIEYREHIKASHVQGSDNNRRKSILYLTGTQEEFQDMFKMTRFSFAPEGENIIGYLLVPLAQMIKMMKKIDSFITEKYLPVRALWDKYKEKPNETKEDFKEHYLKYLQGLQLGNHQATIKKVATDKDLKPPQCPSIISWNSSRIWSVKKKN